MSDIRHRLAAQNVMYEMRKALEVGLPMVWLERSPHGIINLKGNHTKPFDITKFKVIRPRVWGRTVLYSSISLYNPERVEPEATPSNLVPVSEIDWDGPEWVTLRP